MGSCTTRLPFFSEPSIYIDVVVMDVQAKTNRVEAQTMPHEVVTDEQLIAQYRQTGNRELFAELVYRYERELYNYLRRYLNDAELAEDAFQATFLQVHLKCDQFDEGRRFRPWLYAVATNQAIDARRKVMRHRMISLDQTGSSAEGDEVSRLVNLLESHEEAPLKRVERRENSELVRGTLESLPESMYAVIQLVYYQGLKYREAAEILDIPVGTVKSRLHSAIAKLTEAWNSNQVEEIL
jgi:RNA polymerase sigma-70 factor (ECF subfamily)